MLLMCVALFVALLGVWGCLGCFKRVFLKHMLADLCRVSKVLCDLFGFVFDRFRNGFWQRCHSFLGALSSMSGITFLENFRNMQFLRLGSPSRRNGHVQCHRIKIRRKTKTERRAGAGADA